MNDDSKRYICRVCLHTVKEKSTSLFEKYKDFLIFDHINIIANVQIRENDGLPDKICSSCLLDLETAVQFKQKCESSNIILQSSLPYPDNTTSVDYNLVVKKEEPEETQEHAAYVDGDAIYYDDSDLYDAEDIKPLKSIAYNKKRDSEEIRKSRAIDLRLQCHDCGEYFKSKCKLRVHWKRVHQPEALICDVCKRTFKTVRAFQRHKNIDLKACRVAKNVRIEGTGKSRMFYCKECNYKSHRIKDIDTHLVTHTGDRPFPCELCNKTFTQQSSLQAHKESTHQEYLAVTTCHFCGKTLKGRNRIYRHLKIHTSLSLQCPICQKTLKNKNSLKVHLQRHSGVKSYTCEKCAHTFYTSAELANHKRQIHMKGLFWYKCDLCDYKAMRNESVKKHRTKHTGHNISCTVCGRFFDSSQKLILHQRRHFEEKRYPCPHCDRKFFRRDSVGKHVRSKHKCLMLMNRPAMLGVKAESPVVGPQNEEVIEIELSPGNIIRS